MSGYRLRPSRHSFGIKKPVSSRLPLTILVFRRREQAPALREKSEIYVSLSFGIRHQKASGSLFASRSKCIFTSAVSRMKQAVFYKYVLRKQNYRNPSEGRISSQPGGERFHPPQADFTAAKPRFHCGFAASRFSVRDRQHHRKHVLGVYPAVAGVICFLGEKAIVAPPGEISHHKQHVA